MVKCESCDREFNKPEDLAMHNYAKHNIPLNNNSTQSNKSRINSKTILLGISVLAILIISTFFIYGKGLSGNVTSESIQKITLSYKNNNYSPNNLTVKVGVPVEITLDSSIGGCYRSFNIKELGVSKYSSNPSDTIKFTPTKTGSFEFACSMRMGRGIINVI